MKNNSKIYFNGSKWKTNNCGTIEIIGRCDKYNYYICKFEDGTIVEAHSGSIKDGIIKNINFPIVYGVGFLGVGDNLATINRKPTKEYKCWSGMMQRCYSEEYQVKRPSYIGCVVDERWHNFQNFCDDIKELEGYNEWKNSIKEKEYALDKDIKIKENKIYSKDTCMFVTTSQNSIIANSTGLIYIGTRISDNYQEEFTSQKDFAKKYNLNRSIVCNCIKGKQKIHKNWIFKIKI